MDEKDEKKIDEFLGYENDSSFIDFDAISSHKLGEELKNSDGKNVSSEKVDIDPDFAIYVIDLFITRVISISAKFAGYEIKPQDLALTKTEINRIKPYAKKALAKFIVWMEEKFPEYFMFFAVLAMTYSSKAILFAKKVEKGKPQRPSTEQKRTNQTSRAKSASKRVTKTNKIK